MDVVASGRCEVAARRPLRPIWGLSGGCCEADTGPWANGLQGQTSNLSLVGAGSAMMRILSDSLSPLKDSGVYNVIDNVVEPSCTMICRLSRVSLRFAQRAVDSRSTTTKSAK